MGGTGRVKLGRRPALSASDIAYAQAAATYLGARTADLAHELGVGASTLYRSLGRIKRETKEERSRDEAETGDVWQARAPMGFLPRYVRITRTTSFMNVVEVYSGDPENTKPLRKVEWPIGVVERRFRLVRRER